MDHQFYAFYDDVELRPLSRDDTESLRIWRNDSSNSAFLRDIGTISHEQQQKWFDSYLQDGNTIIFAIVETKELKRLVGSIALYGINWNEKTSEIGKILIGDPEAHGKGIGRKALVMAMRIGFLYLGFQKIVGSVHPDNIQAYKNDMKVGFKVVGKCESVAGGYEDMIEIMERDVSSTNHYFYNVLTEDRKQSPSDFYVGKEGRFSKTIIASDIYGFAGITGDFNPVHINKLEAEKSIFGRQVAHGMLVSAFFSTVIGTMMPGPGTVYVKQDSTFVKPVFIDDTITAIVAIEAIEENNRAKLKTTIINQNGEVVVSGKAKVILPTKG